MIVLAIITMLGMIKFVPNVSLSAEANISKELTVFKNPHILIVIAIIVFGYSGVFTTYTFMEPMIRDFSPFKIVGLTVCLFMFGLGGVIGNLITGNVPENKLTKIYTLHFFTIFNNRTICYCYSKFNISINHLLLIWFWYIWYNTVT